jgi:hypothetical protein
VDLVLCSTNQSPLTWPRGLYTTYLGEERPNQDSEPSSNSKAGSREHEVLVVEVVFESYLVVQAWVGVVAAVPPPLARGEVVVDGFGGPVDGETGDGDQGERCDEGGDGDDSEVGDLGGHFGKWVHEE